jgi:hypothetical protein
MGIKYDQVKNWFNNKNNTRRGHESRQKEKDALARLDLAGANIGDFFTIEPAGKDIPGMNPAVTSCSVNIETPTATAQQNSRQPDPLNVTGQPSQAPIVPRSQRHLKALAAIQEQAPTPEELRLEFARLNFRVSVIDNVVSKHIPAFRSSRYLLVETEIQEMGPAEQQLELADSKFQLSIIQTIQDAQGAA